MCSRNYWLTPFMKQCYVTLGVSLNMCNHGLVSGFSAILLPELRSPESSIQVDETSESWIASVFGITFIIGNIINPIVMEKYGRKKTNLVTVIIGAGGWYMLVWASNIPWLIISRSVQGVALGFTCHLCPIIIGEYSSPRYRGAFLATVSLAISCGVLVVHAMGLFLSWRTIALVCAIILTIDFFLILFSPETPCWLIKKGRYDECKEVFRWLRGMTEEDELRKMVEANINTNISASHIKHTILRQHLKSNFDYLKTTVIKKEFYRPILIVIHLYTLGQWGGSINLSQYSPDIFKYVVGDRIDTALMTVILTTHRVISGVYMTFIMAKFRRRTLIITLTIINVVALFVIALYAYTRSKNLLPFDHPAVGVILMHIHMVTTCSGGLALGFIIAGELFPLEYKSLAGGLSIPFMSGNLFIVAKTASYFFTKLGIHVAYCIYGGVCFYCLVVIWIFLPETKDRTLQEIEDEFRKKKSPEEVQTVELLSRH